jgi:hypothetical protein
MAVAHGCGALKLLTAVIFLASIGSTAQAQAAVTKPCPETAARVFLMHSGAVTLNGNVVEASLLGKALSSIRPLPSEVCIAQEDAADQSSDLGSFVEGLIFMKMPVSMYTDGTFIKRTLRIPKGDS